MIFLSPFKRGTNVFKAVRFVVIPRKNFAMDKDILKPLSVPGMHSLDRSLFNKTINIPVLNICPEVLETLRPVVKPYMLKLPHLKPVITEKSTEPLLIHDKQEDNKIVESCPSSDSKVAILLNPSKVLNWVDIDLKTVKKLEEIGISECNMTTTSITLTYENWNADEILRAVLPAGVEIARSFSKVGHIIHLNLRDHLLPYKQIIGEVLLDKTSSSKSVVNKTTVIDNTFRNFQMEIICGDDNMVTTVKENGRTFEFDFSEVYWNSRLSTEHQRIVDQLTPKDVLLDVFCGVGPFAIPCAKKGCKVYANDLNPNCFKWLNHNIKLNKVKECNIETFNKDGSNFIKNDIKRILLQLEEDVTFNGKIHVTMNLPALALEFVNHFKDLFNPEEVKNKCLDKISATVHVYFFVNGTEPRETAFKDFKDVTGLNITEETAVYQYVRNVSPKKDMVKISLRLPWTYLIRSQNVESELPPSKRQCTQPVASVV